MIIKNVADYTDYNALRTDAIKAVQEVKGILEDTLALLNIDPVMLDAHECAEALAGMEGATKELVFARDAYIHSDELEDEWYRNMTE